MARDLKAQELAGIARRIEALTADSTVLPGRALWVGFGHGMAIHFAAVVVDDAETTRPDQRYKVAWVTELNTGWAPVACGPTPEAARAAADKAALKRHPRVGQLEPWPA